MRTETIDSGAFEPRRVLEAAALLGGAAVLIGVLLSGWHAAGGAALGAATGAAAFTWLEKSLRRGGLETRRGRLIAGSLGRTLLWGVAAVLVCLGWGEPGGAGFLAGALAVKAAVLVEGLRCRGG